MSNHDMPIIFLVFIYFWFLHLKRAERKNACIGYSWLKMGWNNNHNNGHVEMKKSWLIKRSPWNLARHRMLAQWDQIIFEGKFLIFWSISFTWLYKKKSSTTQVHKTIYRVNQQCCPGENCPETPPETLHRESPEFLG